MTGGNCAFLFRKRKGFAGALGEGGGTKWYLD
jgi:hypothetical protein